MQRCQYYIHGARCCINKRYPLALHVHKDACMFVDAGDYIAVGNHRHHMTNASVHSRRCRLPDFYVLLLRLSGETSKRRAEYNKPAHDALSTSVEAKKD